MEISIICIYNDQKQLDNCLIKSLRKQSIKYELILVDGSEKKYESCASALNYGVSESHGEILVFTHQDIILKREKELELFTQYISEMPTGTIVGIAGALEKNKFNIGNYTSGLRVNEQLIRKISSPIQVSCVDECFFGMKKSTYNEHKFNEFLCDNWHLYAVEQCLYHRKYEGRVFVYPSQIHHLSKGKINLYYMNGLVKLADEYRENFKYIWTTCYKVNTDYYTIRLLRFIWIMNRKIKRRQLY